MTQYLLELQDLIENPLVELNNPSGVVSATFTTVLFPFFDGYPHYSFCVVSSFSYSFNRMLTRDTDFFSCGESTFWAGHSVESYESFYRCIDTDSDEDQYNSDSISSEQERIPSKVIRLN
jgi:hypothetical protein